MGRWLMMPLDSNGQIDCYDDGDDCYSDQTDDDDGGGGCCCCYGDVLVGGFADDADDGFDVAFVYDVAAAIS